MMEQAEEQLAQLPCLDYLMVGGDGVTDAGLQHLARLTQLRELHLFHANVTDEGVTKLQQALPNCKITH